MDEQNMVTQPQVTEEVQAQPSSMEQAPEVATPSQETPKLKVKYLHEEKELDINEAVPYVQKGMDYDRVRDRYESTKPVLSFVEELAKENGLSVEQYIEAVKEWKEQERIRSLAEQEGISEELASRLTMLERKEIQREQERIAYEQQQRQTMQYQEFFDYFKAENGRTFDPERDTISDEVWTMVNTGKPLIDAYQYHEARTLKQKIREMEEKLNIQTTNQKNAESSTGSVTGNGAIGDDFISLETFNANKHDRNWIIKNFNKITNSRSKWSG